uniref:Eukaryotic translation initiation factor 5B n=1 Tax=Kalanchoe fedtschenkoi TaxID=63787 RepID=A0A7N0ZZK6_KALFE
MAKEKKGKKGGSKGTRQDEEEEVDLVTEEFAAGKKKGKGKMVAASASSSVGDDDNDDHDEVSEEPEFTGKKKAGKKKAPRGSSSLAALDDDDGNDEVAAAFTGKKKSSKKKSSGVPSFAELDDEDGGLDEEPAPAPARKKSSKKVGGSSFASGFAALGDEDDVKEDTDEEPDPAPARKNSSKKGGASSFASGFAALDEEEDTDEESAPAPVGKKPSKERVGGGGSFASGFAALGEDEDDDIDIDDDNGEIEESSKRGGSSFSSFAAALLDEEDNGGFQEEEEEEVSLVNFGGKKKSSKNKKTKGLIVEDDSVDYLDEPANNDTVTGEDPKDSVSNDQLANDTSKNKKKKNKKKSGRTDQEEDDLDKILAELGEAHPVSNVAPLPKEDKNVQPQTASVDTTIEDEKAEGIVESAAAKKKKKKKEKEKEKKAAAAAAAIAEPEPAEEEEKLQTHAGAVEATAENEKGDEEVGESSSAAKKKKKKKDKEKEKKEAAPEATKKVPKAVREMQEEMARRKEAEERKRKEEEERLRKEEEERLRQEELERQAEEARRRKKEREKEKLLKKKQEGKLLTAKQKEEARRLEAMRNQFLATAGGLPQQDDENNIAKPKRPVYKAKKSKQHPVQANGTTSAKPNEDTELEENHGGDEVDSEKVESDNVNDADVASIMEKSEFTDTKEQQEVKEETDDEWDAKSWDDADLKLPNLGAFADEEIDSSSIQEVAKDVKKETKSVKAPSQDAGARQAIVKPVIAVSQDAENEKNHADEEAVSKIKKKDAGGKKGPAVPESSSKKGDVDLRSPICCIMGHVDTGKTKLLDCIRGTNVQEGEAGGITQQIGATYFPAENIRERTKELKADATLKVPGLLVIDTPGHESFTNLRTRGSGLCDIAILVVDIMHGLEPQTIESLNLLKMRNTEFIVALNKVDRLYNWKTCRNAPIVTAMKQQTRDVQNEFNMRLKQIITQFMEQGMNTQLYYKNKEMGETFSIVPTSAISGEGIPDLLLLLVQWTQKTMVEKLTFSNEVQCTVLEVKVVEGHGTTIDVVLVNGVLHEGDQIVVCGMQGPIVTTIRALLTPHPMKELRVKGTYLHHKEIKAAQGIKITAQGLEHAVAGTGLYVVGPEDNVEDVKEEAMEDMKSVMNRIDKTGEGVCVQASTLGSLEALLEFLKTPAVNIPVSGISIGPVHKKDVMKASVMLEKKKEYAAILAFDVKVTPEARELAEEYGVKIFIADIIYHLFDQFKAYIDTLKEEKKKEAADEAVFPCVLKIMPNCVFNKKDPIVLGVDVLEGIAKVGTPICIPQKEFIDIGRIASIENNHKPVDIAKKGQKVAIKIVGSNPEEQQKMFGRHFEIEDELVSHISRRSIDVLKENYRDDLSIEDWKLVVKLKALFKIQ